MVVAAIRIGIDSAHEDGWSKALRSHGHDAEEQFGEVVDELQAHHAMASQDPSYGTEC